MTRRRVERLSHRLARDGGSGAGSTARAASATSFRSVIIADPYLDHHHAIRPPMGPVPSTACHMNGLSTIVGMRSLVRTPHF